jgi:hypothetical protein
VSLTLAHLCFTQRTASHSRSCHRLRTYSRRSAQEKAAALAVTRAATKRRTDLVLKNILGSVWLTGMGLIGGINWSDWWQGDAINVD